MMFSKSQKRVVHLHLQERRIYSNGKRKLHTGREKDIKKDVLAENIIFDSCDGYVKEWNINGEAVTMGVKKA